MSVVREFFHVITVTHAYIMKISFFMDQIFNLFLKSFSGLTLENEGDRRTEMSERILW
jgi:hypothetical protein